MFFKYFLGIFNFSRTFQDIPVYSSTFQACANPVPGTYPCYIKSVLNNKYREKGFFCQYLLYWDLVGFSIYIDFFRLHPCSHSIH